MVDCVGDRKEAKTAPKLLGWELGKLKSTYRSMS